MHSVGASQQSNKWISADARGAVLTATPATTSPPMLTARSFRCIAGAGYPKRLGAETKPSPFAAKKNALAQCRRQVNCGAGKARQNIDQFGATCA